MKRRDFIFGTAAAATGAAILPNLWGCKKDDEVVVDQIQHFKYLEVSGTNYEVGKQIGSHFKNQILGTHMGMGNLITDLHNAVQQAPEIFYTPFVEAAQNVFPDYVDEIQGIADGCGISFKDVMIPNILMEIAYLAKELSGGKISIPIGNLGCSSVAYSVNGKQFLSHNEDLFTSFLNGMYVLKISVPGKPQIINLSYPGMLSGIPPGMNEAGIVQSGNDICGLHIEQTVPLVFHFRSVLDATSLDDAIARATITQRSRTMTHNIGSMNENKIVSVEAAPSKYQTHDVDGFFVHTNHFILPEMLDIEIDEDSLPSSVSRFNELTSESNGYVDKPDQVKSELFTQFLSSHNGEYCPCVHNNHDASTLAHAVFDFNTRDMRLYYSNPCLGNLKVY